MAMVASLVGGAILLFSCSGDKKSKEFNLQTMITQQSDSLTMVYTKNGVKEYRFWTPLMERYEFARDPYMEFRRGINIITFDTLGNDNSKLRADYAIFYEKRELWETRGNVVGESSDGRKLYTQQLFWDQKTDKVYSNVDCKIVDGDDEFVGEGFESDSEFNDWLFRESEGRMWVDTSQSENPQPSADKSKNNKVVEEQKEEPKPNSYLEEQEARRRKEQERKTRPNNRRNKNEEGEHNTEMRAKQMQERNAKMQERNAKMQERGAKMRERGGLQPSNKLPLTESTSQEEL